MEIGVHIILNKYKNRLDLRCLSFIVSAKLTGSLQPFVKLKKNLKASESVRLYFRDKNAVFVSFCDKM